MRKVQGNLSYLLCCRLTMRYEPVSLKQTILHAGLRKVHEAEHLTPFSVASRAPFTGDEEAVYVYCDMADINLATVPKAGSEVTLKVRPLLCPLCTDNIA